MSEDLILPAEAPVMTLPNTVLFPHALLPLYIFEPRYRQMLGDVLQGNRFFAVAALDPARAQEPDQVEPAFAIAGLGMVRASHENADGTSNLIVQGVARVRFRGIVGETPYRRCALEVLPTAPGAAATELRRQRLALLHQLEQFREVGGSVPEEAVGFLRTLREPEVFLDIAAFTLCSDPGEKQKLLEELDTATRFSRFLRHLRAETARLRLTRKLQGPLSDEDVSRN
ncbi:MAG: LON peptidase substrate-binding domain-containing protein [Opitutales bacterium]|jgi:Lon protease-like protein